ncbi:DUF4012 domain-containing protein [Cellulomonas sp. PhB143]|uniref:DUF4012 domain-containing protein n=1 Tax=Cellulomonas sp. PhB143 TaxID=2485186 RepID=UPI000F496B1E|nr:DUF4012 domain-containing protein [Cellulomonas sp. PhB143]ROS78852.1 uncharacterized protein DUF4012 [Cellulomonas sp. PhB143]
MSAPSTPVESPSDRPTGRPARRRRRRHVARWVLLVVGVLVVAVVVGGIVLAKQALTAQDALRKAATMLPAAEDAVRAGDVDAASAALDDVRPLTHRARVNTDGPLWAVAAHAPGIGPDLAAVSTTAASVDRLTQDVLPPLAQVAQVLDGDGLRPVDGTIDLAPLNAAVPVVSAASDSADEVAADLDAVDTDDLLPLVAGPVTDLRDRTTELAATLRTGERLVRLLPPVLGADGPRTYLLMNLNNAELRAAGGIPGSLAEIHADAGRITLGTQASTGAVGPFDEPVAKLAPEDEKLYSDRLGRYVQDTVLTPDFPTSAALTAEMWRRSQGTEVDGVLATDPVALSYLLGATGPVTTQGTTLTADNAVSYLLSGVYADHEGHEATDAFFAGAAAAVFGTALGGSVGAGDVQGALAHAADEHRLQFWSTHAEEQSLVADTEASGAIDTAERADGSLGVFFNDAVSGKLTYYLDSDIEVTGSRCTAQGRVDSLRITLASRVPKDAATSLPDYVLGDEQGAERVDLTTYVVLYPPRGGWVSDIVRGKDNLGGQSAVVGDRRAIELPQTLAPGASATITLDVHGPGAAPTDPVVPGGTDRRVDLWSTPTATEPGLQTFTAPC